jgi:solute carrier family 25 phosphate transporter 23/24/25/41
MHLSFVSFDSPLSCFDCQKLIFLNSDVLRRRFQINTMSGMGYQYTSIWDAVRVIVAEEGLRGLFKGIGPNLLKVAPSMASSWLSFEMTRDFLVTLGDKE